MSMWLRKLSFVARTGPHRFQVEFLLESAQHIVRDRALVSEANQHAAFGGNHRQAQATTACVTTADDFRHPRSLSRLGAQYFNIARIDPIFVREIVQRLGTATRRLSARELFFFEMLVFRLEAKCPDDWLQ